MSLVVVDREFLNEPSKSSVKIDKTKKICIIGTGHTGSTRLFNLVRLIYEKKGKTVYSKLKISPKEINELDRKYDIILGKIHDTDISYVNHFDINLLPIRNIIDAAMSAGARFKKDATKSQLLEYYKDRMYFNIKMFNKFKPKADFIFRYEEYSVNQIKKLCSVLDISLDNKDILEIMNTLENMLNSKEIVVIDDLTDEMYRKTLLSQDHNTSGGKSNKFIGLPIENLNIILNDNNIVKFLEETSYF